MRLNSSIFLLVLYGLALLHPVMPYIEYQVNHSYIIANLCENVDKPELQCNGACHLKKQIKEQTKEKESPGKVLIDVDKLPIAVLSPLPASTIYIPVRVSHQPRTTLLTGDFQTDIFHPPSA